MRFCGAHVVGHAENNESNDLANSALVTEIICHCGGPRYIMQIIPVSHLKAPELKDILLETASTVQENGGMLISFICDNCPLNQGTYHALGGLGRAYLPALGIHVYLVYDFVHIFKNLRNNWITEPSKDLTFNVVGNEYVAKWADIVKLYEEDKQATIRLTKLTYSHCNAKVSPLVWQVFHG